MLIQDVDVDIDERVMQQLLALPYRFEVDKEGHIVLTPLQAPGLTWEQLATSHPIIPEALTWKVETDAQNRIIMSPAPIIDHQEYGSEMMMLLNKLMPHGRALHECGVRTSNGTRVADLVWISKERRQAHNRRPSFRLAPEICIEVISKGNSRREITEKTKLHLEAGAVEVWTCDQTGNLSFHTVAGQIERSVLCPDFPLHINPFA